MTSRALRMLYREIPATSPCKVGCMDCCGPVPWSPEELARVQADIPPGTARVEIAGVTSMQNPATGLCPFASPQGCRVYDRRPFMCRLFGTTNGAGPLSCPYGVKAAQPLSAQRAASLTDTYTREHADG